MKKSKKAALVIGGIAGVILVSFLVSTVRKQMRNHYYSLYLELRNECDAEGAMTYAQKSGSSFAVKDAERLQQFLALYENGDWEEAAVLINQSSSALSGTKDAAFYCDCYYETLIPQAEDAVKDGNLTDAIEALLQFHNRFNDGTGNANVYRNESWQCDFDGFQTHFPEKASRFFDLVCETGDLALENRQEDAIALLSGFETSAGSKPRTFSAEEYSFTESLEAYRQEMAEIARRKKEMSDNPREIFSALNETTDDFAWLYGIYLEEIEERGMTEEWSAFGADISAAFDYLRSPMYRLYGVYELKMNGLNNDIPYVNIVREGIRPELLMDVYTPGNYVEGIRALWLKQEYTKATSGNTMGGLTADGNGVYQADWSHPMLWQFAKERYNVDACGIYAKEYAKLTGEDAAEEQEGEDTADEADDADAVDEQEGEDAADEADDADAADEQEGEDAADEADDADAAGEADEEVVPGEDFHQQITELVCKEAGITGEAFMEAYAAYLDEEKERLALRDAYAEGDSIRILIVDESDTIMGDKITAELLTDSGDRKSILDRAERVLEVFTKHHPGDFRLTGYPELADVVIKLTTSYPYAGKYAYSDGTRADVYNTVLDITAIDTRDNKTASLRLGHYAGNTVSVSGGIKIYMYVPKPGDEQWAEKASEFADKIYGWYAGNE